MQTPAPTSRRAAAAFAASAALFAVLPQASLAGVITPDSAASPVQSDTNMLYVGFLALGGFAVLGVAALVIGAARSGGSVDAAGPDGGTKMAVIASSVLFVLLAAVGLICFTGARTADASLAGTPADFKPAPLQDPTLKTPVSVKPPKGPSISVQVNGQQYLWRYSYLGNSVSGVPVTSYHDLVVPAGVTVLLDFTSSDVTHSWWVPRIGGSFEAVPGYLNKGWIRVDEPGEYEGYSTTPSGPNYPSMTTTVKALAVDDFKTWLDDKKTQLSAAYDELGKSEQADSEPAGATASTAAAEVSAK